MFGSTSQSKGPTLRSRAVSRPLPLMKFSAKPNGPTTVGATLVLMDLRNSVATSLTLRLPVAGRKATHQESEFHPITGAGNPGEFLAISTPWQNLLYPDPTWEVVRDRAVDT